MLQRNVPQKFFRGSRRKQGCKINSKTGNYVKHIILYRCQNCGGPEKKIALPYVREFVLSCSGQLEAIHILRAFEDGEQGVCIVICDTTRCKTLEGSTRALRRIKLAEHLLMEAGIDKKRLMTIRFEPDRDITKELSDFHALLQGA